MRRSSSSAISAPTPAGSSKSMTIWYFDWPGKVVSRPVAMTSMPSSGLNFSRAEGGLPHHRLEPRPVILEREVAMTGGMLAAEPRDFAADPDIGETVLDGALHRVGDLGNGILDDVLGGRVHAPLVPRHESRVKGGIRHGSSGACAHSSRESVDHGITPCVLAPCAMSASPHKPDAGPNLLRCPSVTQDGRGTPLAKPRGNSDRADLGRRSHRPVDWHVNSRPRTH